MDAPVCPNCDCGQRMREVLSYTDRRSMVTTREWECPRCCHRLTTREDNGGGEK